ncbi:hypothetical protein [Leucobacter sp. USHLN153]|uniref:hypothetical protein n=1 Tax=Leucobacter sp. USHLN153 TaxID=3081268 RepID=UPI0030179BD6
MNPFRLATRLQPPARPRSRQLSGAAPLGRRAEEAVVVPWRVVQRSESGVIELESVGGAPMYSVRAALAGDGMLGLSLPRTVLPGERLRVVLRGVHSEGALAAPDAMLVMRWFQPDGRELLWPISLA